MKPSFFILPVAALLAVFLWIANGRRMITTLETQTTELRQRIAARLTGDGLDSSLASPSGKSLKKKQPVDWRNFAGKFLEMNQSGGVQDMRTMLILNQRIPTLSRSELIAALDEIDALGLPDRSWQRVQINLFGPLCRIDPQYALTRYIGKMDQPGGMNGMILSNAMLQWAIKDATAAAAWLDSQIADGKFEAKSLNGKSQPRIWFEGSLITSLLASDPTAAGDRLAVLPEEQRAEILKGRTALWIKEEDQAAFATLVRSQLSEQEQLETLAGVAERSAYGNGFDKVDAYLDRIEATPAERAASVNEAIGTKTEQISTNNKITREDIDGFRQWAATQSPDSVDKATATAIARSTNPEGVNHELKFSEAADLLSFYHTSSGNDDVIVEFFNEPWQARQHKDKEQAIKLAEQISDPIRREEILRKLN